MQATCPRPNACGARGERNQGSHILGGRKGEKDWRGLMFLGSGRRHGSKEARRLGGRGGRRARKSLMFVEWDGGEMDRRSLVL
ncbi:hypothetical protein FKM82_019721 [Ascaphus truei]